MRHRGRLNLHLAEIATQIARRALHAALLVDQASAGIWSGGLIVPPNITLIALPAKCPELNPQENIWQFMRENWLSNRVFKSFNDIVDPCCDAWNKLIDKPLLLTPLLQREFPSEITTATLLEAKSFGLGVSITYNRRVAIGEITYNLHCQHGL